MSAARLLVVGGDAAGMSAAAAARRLRGAPDLAITVLEQGPEVSYSACGIPYWVGDVVEDRDELIARTPREFAARDIEVRTGTRAEELDLDAGTVRTSTGETLGFDRLVVATGGRPPRPGVPGLGAPGGPRGHRPADGAGTRGRSEEDKAEPQSRPNLVFPLFLLKKKNKK